MKTLEEKKNLLNEAIKLFKFKGKVVSFTEFVAKETRLTELDRLASNLILNKTDKVVALLNR